jgi:2-methylcitrate dehydratase PrpD
LSDEVLHDPDVLRLAAKVNPVMDDACRTDLSPGATIIELETSDRKKISRKTMFPPGHPDYPMDMDACINKFEKSVKYAHEPFRKDQIDRLIHTLSELEHLESIPRLAQLLVPGS